MIGARTLDMQSMWFSIVLWPVIRGTLRGPIWGSCIHGTGFFGMISCKLTVNTSLRKHLLQHSNVLFTILAAAPDVLSNAHNKSHANDLSGDSFQKVGGGGGQTVPKATFTMMMVFLDTFFIYAGKCMRLIATLKTLKDNLTVLIKYIQSLSRSRNPPEPKINYLFIICIVLHEKLLFIIARPFQTR